jgi:hypothetical protein
MRIGEEGISDDLTRTVLNFFFFYARRRINVFDLAA